MVHRAILGSIERFVGVLTEHYGGAFPVWLAPVQAVVVPVAPAFSDYAKEVEEFFRAKGFRVEADLSDLRMNAKIRNAQNQKIPYMFIVGEKEMEAGGVSLRLRTGKQTNGLSRQEVMDFMAQKVADKEDL